MTRMASAAHRRALIAAVCAFASCAAMSGQAQDDTEFEPLAPYVLGQADEAIATTIPEPWQTETITFEVNGFVENYGQIEYKISMQEGDVLLYSWRASEPIYYEFHGHTLDPDGRFGEAMLYRIEQGEQSHGVVQAPLDGYHGWFFLNRNFERSITIELTLAGTYTREPGLIWQR